MWLKTIALLEVLPSPSKAPVTLVTFQGLRLTMFQKRSDTAI